MHPVMFHIGKFPIHSYGLMLAVSFLLGIWYSSWRAKKRGLDPNVISDVGFYLIVAAILGSRLYYVALHFEEFSGNLLSIINPFHGGAMGIGGLVMYGGFIGAIAAGVLYFKIKKLPFLPYADAVAPSIGFGIFLTRIGCFLNGCCYGAPTNLPFGMHFPADSPAGYYQLKLGAKALHDAAHTVPAINPSQLYESVGGLVMALIIIGVGSRKPFAGLQFYLVGLLYSVLRFFVDLTRFYSVDERLGPLSHNQIVCIVAFAVFGGLILREFVGRDGDGAHGTIAPTSKPPSSGSSPTT